MSQIMGCSRSWERAERRRGSGAPGMADADDIYHDRPLVGWPGEGMGGQSGPIMDGIGFMQRIGGAASSTRPKLD